MEDAVRKRLRLTLTTGLSLLPRWFKHDFWRQCEPQHDRAERHIVEALIRRIEDEYDVRERARVDSSGGART
jgi:hypothetical protein